LHRPLERLADGLWQVEADLALLPIGRRMTIVRLGGGELVVHNAVACDEPTMAAIEALGPLRWIVVPSGHHRMDAHAFASRFAAARVVTPAGSAARVAARCRVDGGLELLPRDPSLVWAPLAGVPAEAALVHTDPRGAVTLIFNDAFMNLPDRLPGVKGAIVRLIGSTGGPKVTRTARWFIVDDRAAYAAQLRRLAATPGLARVIPGHGLVLRDAAAAAAGVLRAADGLHRAAPGSAPT
jgi:Domain of unknown function (DUF4336)